MLKIGIKTDNAAFTDAPCDECARILRDIATKMDNGRVEGVCLDYNGNRVGTWELDLDEPE